MIGQYSNIDLESLNSKKRKTQFSLKRFIITFLVLAGVGLVILPIVGVLTKNDNIVDIFSKSLKLLITRDSVYCKEHLSVFKRILSFPENSFLIKEYSCYILNEEIGRFGGTCPTNISTSLVVPQDLPSITVTLQFEDDGDLTELEYSLKTNFTEFRKLYSSKIDANDEENLINHEAIFEVDPLTNINNYEFKNKKIKMINVGRIIEGTKQTCLKLGTIIIEDIKKNEGKNNIVYNSLSDEETCTELNSKQFCLSMSIIIMISIDKLELLDKTNVISDRLEEVSIEFEISINNTSTTSSKISETPNVTKSSIPSSTERNKTTFLPTNTNPAMIQSTTSLQDIDVELVAAL
ncbi:hypothetical protein SNEBB_008447 [Seison nebaliae]|nr:hypothetical protein SNEBB_008447 [Seison nebaliae]